MLMRYNRPVAGLLTESFLVGLPTAKQGSSRCPPFTHTHAAILEPFVPISAGHAALTQVSSTCSRDAS